MQTAYSKEVVAFLIAANIIVIGFAAFVVLILRIQQKRKIRYRQQLLEQEFKTRETSMLQLSRDLHDEIGSSLSGINMLCQLAMQRLQSKQHPEAEQLLSKIHGYTTEVIDKVNDMVWLLKPGDESFSIVLQKIRTYALTTAASQGIEVYFNIVPMDASSHLDLPERKAIYLISKEALNNAFKYARCRHIFYTLTAGEKQTTLRIRDDGKGFIPALASHGNGLLNMQTRAKEVNAALTIESKENQGTLVELRMPGSMVS